MEIYKFLHNLSLCFMNNKFKVNQTVRYDLRKQNVLQSGNPISLSMARRPYGHLFPKL